MDTSSAALWLAGLLLADLDRLGGRLSYGQKWLLVLGLAGLLAGWGDVGLGFGLGLLSLMMTLGHLGHRRPGRGPYFHAANPARWRRQLERGAWFWRGLLALPLLLAAGAFFSGHYYGLSVLAVLPLLLPLFFLARHRRQRQTRRLEQLARQRWLEK